MFIAGEGHVEDLGIWRRHREYIARYIGREHASGEKAKSEQLQTKRHPHQASVREGRENASVFPALDPPKRNTTTTNSVAYVDCYHATGFSCPISQT
jgi:hypothetical protein